MESIEFKDVLIWILCFIMGTIVGASGGLK